MTPTGNEPVTCRLVAQYLNQLRHRVFLKVCVRINIHNLYTDFYVLELR
jgi:hypothetical protein